MRTLAVALVLAGCLVPSLADARKPEKRKPVEQRQQPVEEPVDDDVVGDDADDPLGQLTPEQLEQIQKAQREALEQLQKAQPEMQKQLEEARRQLEKMQQSPEMKEQLEQAQRMLNEQIEAQREATQAGDEMPPEPEVNDLNDLLQDDKTVTADGKPEFTEQQYQAIGFAGMCCCLVAVGGIIALVVFLVRRGSKKADAPVAAPAAVPGQPAPAPNFNGPHLSVMAIAIPAETAGWLETQLLAEGINTNPVTPAERATLVRVMAARLASVSPQWSHFGYGEHAGLTDLAAAERSYRTASEDFRRRAFTPSNGIALPTHRVVALVLCSTRPLLGVSRLDTRDQVKAMLEAREKLADTDLLGADLVWSIPLNEAEMSSRYPEMHGLSA